MDTLFDFIEEDSVDLYDYINQHIKDKEDIDVRKIKDEIENLEEDQFLDKSRYYLDLYPLLVSSGYKKEAHRLVMSIYIQASRYNERNIIDKCLSYIDRKVDIDDLDELSLDFLVPVLYRVLDIDDGIYLISFIEDRISRTNKKNCEDLVYIYIKVLENNHTDNKDIINRCKLYFAFERVIRYMVDKCIEDKEYDLACMLIKQYIDNRLDCFVEYQIKLKDLYKLTNNVSLYKSQLFLLASIIVPGRQDIVDELRLCYDDKKWEEIYSQIQLVSNSLK